MSIYVKVNNTEYPATVNGNLVDRNWNGRDTKTIYLTMPYDAVAALLPDNTPWSIIQRDTVDVLDEQGKPTGETKEVVNEYDNSAYSIAGDITDHRDGTVSIKMGKPTESELSAATVTALVGQSITPQRAARLRPMIEQASASLSDGEAAKSPALGGSHRRDRQARRPPQRYGRKRRAARLPRQQRSGPHHARELAAAFHPCHVDDHQRRPRGHAG